MYAAIDFGLTNTDIAYAAERDIAPRFLFIPSGPELNVRAVERALRATGQPLEAFVRVAVTGGQHRRLPAVVAGAELVKVNEVEAIGRGGLALSNHEAALVVSAGSGTACVAARQSVHQHISGSAVGGGTLLGLSRLLLNTTDPLAIDRLAQAGDANAVDTTLIEAVGGEIGRLPADTNAVNFGKVEHAATLPRREDIAAGLARMIGQTIGIIAANAARAEGLEDAVFIGRLMELVTIRKAVLEVARVYGLDGHFRLPPKPGSGTVLGAFRSL